LYSCFFRFFELIRIGAASGGERRARDWPFVGAPLGAVRGADISGTTS